MTSYQKIEEFIEKFPIYQYGFLTPDKIEHSEKIRTFCKRDCPKYDSNWSCPPAIPRISKCRQRCSSYDDVLVFSTVAATEEMSREKRAETKKSHEELTKIIEDFFINADYEVYTLTSDVCTMCSKCTFPHTYCKHQELMHPCIESHGLIISDICSELSMDYNMGERLHLWFTVMYFRPAQIEG